MRVVPIPPVLVAPLRDHIERFGTTADGRLFQVTWGQRGKGGVVSTKVYGPAWQKTRSVALTKAQQGSPLAGRPYDLRHDRVTLALNAGVPTPEVAARVGHSVEVHRRVQAGCVHGQEKLWNRRIEEALTEYEDPGNDPPDGRGSWLILFRPCSANTRQRRGAAGKCQDSTRSTPGRIAAGQGLSLAGGGGCCVQFQDMQDRVSQDIEDTCPARQMG